MKSKNEILNNKDYLILTICLVTFFIVGSYLLAGCEIPKNKDLIYIWVASIIFAVPLVLFTLKKLID